MKNANPLFYVPLKFGLYGSLINIIAILMLYYFGKHPLLLNPLFDARLPLFIIFIFFSLKTYREQYNEGVMHFWQGMTVGVVNYMSMAITVALFIQIFAGIESTGFLSEYVQLVTDKIMANKESFIESIGQKTFDDTLKQLPATTALHLAADFLLKSMPVGLFLTIILAVLMRRN